MFSPDEQKATAMVNPDISIVIPAYNEEKRLPAYLASVLEYVGHSPYRFEVIVVDDGSNDSTAAIVEGMAKHHHGLAVTRLERNRGKGEAVRVGMLQASGARRLFVDADGATPISELERLMKVMDSGYDMVVASRACKDDQCTVRYKMHRKVMGTIFNLLVRMTLGLTCSDTQCGFKLMKADAATVLFQFQQLQGFGFDIELLYVARKLGLRQAETAINWRDITGSKVSLVKDSVRMFTDVIKVRYYDLRGYYSIPPND